MTLSSRLHRTLAPRHICAAVFASFAIASAHAEDIDIFAANSADSHHPNVLIIIDNSSNWSASLPPSAACTAAGYPGTKFGAEMCALSNVITGLPTTMRVGLMMFAESGDNGAYVRFGIRDMTDGTNGTVDNKSALKNMLNNMVSSGNGTDNSGSNQPYAKTMFEAFKYFGGYSNQALATKDQGGSPVSNVGFGNTAFAGGNSNNAGTYRRDYPGNNGANNRAATFYKASANSVYGSTTLSDYAYTSSDGDTYNSPIRDGCAKNFIIFISNGNPGTGGDSSINPARDTQIMTTLSVTPTQLPPAPATETHASKMDEMAKFLYETDVSSKTGQQNVQTFTVAVYVPQSNGSISNTDQQMINLMQSAATYGGGKFCSAKTADEVAACINSILNELQAVNSVFVSSSLPVSVNAQGTYLNQVYMGMFRPDRGGSPRWVGNLKEYKVDKDSIGNLFLADSVDLAAVNPTTGFISPNAKSYWSAASTFWTNNVMGTPPTASDLPDGEVVEKGGAAQQVRTAYSSDQSTRRMFSCPSTGCTAGTLSYSFNQTNMVTAANVPNFGVADTTELDKLVRWIRGQDNYNADPCPVGSSSCGTWTSAEKGPGWPTTVRPSVHGDVLHARPVVLNYSTVGPYVFYGANDGVLRAIKGGRDGSTDGKESWSFIAPEFFAKYRRLRNGSPVINLPTVLGSVNVKDYFFDGPIGSYQDSSKAWIFVTARRGGRFLYAFDVTDPTNPKFMWKKSNADTNMSELGQTWSEPKAVKVKAFADPVLIFGAGYDPTEDNNTPGATTMGRGVFVLNARTGDFIKLFQVAGNSSGTIAKSVPSDVAVIDRDQDTFADRAYVGDMGGNMWRMDIDDPDYTKWKLEKIASLGTMKFFYRPDVIPTSTFDEVLFGSGDREKPLISTNQDYFFMVKDFATGTDGSTDTVLGFSDLVLNGTSASPAKGWYVQLSPGEKVVNAPLTIGGITFFATNQPAPPPEDGTCSVNLGIARAYAVDFVTGGAGIDRNGDGTKNSSDISRTLAGGGLPPSAVGGTLQLDDGSTTAFCIGCGGGGKPPDAEKPPVTIPKVRKKLYWNVGTDK